MWFDLLCFLFDSNTKGPYGHLGHFCQHYAIPLLDHNNKGKKNQKKTCPAFLLSFLKTRKHGRGSCGGDGMKAGPDAEWKSVWRHSGAQNVFFFFWFLLLSPHVYVRCVCFFFAFLGGCMCEGARTQRPFFYLGVADAAIVRLPVRTPAHLLGNLLRSGRHPGLTLWDASLHRPAWTRAVTQMAVSRPPSVSHPSPSTTKETRGGA